MGTTPEQFFESFVQGNYDDCEANPGCVRRAFNAAVSAAHLADHYYTFNQRNNPSLVSAHRTTGDFLKHVSESTGHCFRDIRSISNAYKHLYESNDPKKSAHSTVSSSGAIERIDFADSGLEICNVEEGFVSVEGRGIADSKVVFTRKDGQRVDFLPALKSVVDYWYDLLYRSGANGVGA